MVSDDFLERARQLLNHIRFFAYRFEVKLSPRGECFLQLNYDEKDIYTQQVEIQYTRKWILSQHMTDSEIVQTAFKACLTSMEHRTREHFTYRGARIFGPHFDVDDLVRLCKDGKENAGGRAEQSAALPA